jgi:hypothetical protein
MKITGRCLCGAVTYSINGQPLGMGQCHCKDCQRASGTGHMSLARFKKDDVAINGKRPHMHHERTAATSTRATSARLAGAGSMVKTQGAQGSSMYRSAAWMTIHGSRLAWWSMPKIARRGTIPQRACRTTNACPRHRRIRQNSRSVLLADPQVFGRHHPNIATPRPPSAQVIRRPISIQYRMGVASL